MPRTPAQFEEMREKRKALILDAALHLFAEKGFASTSISMIAKQAGISKGLIYNYFASKEALIKTIIIDGFKVFDTVFDQNKDGNLTDKEFVFFIEQSFEILKSNVSFWKLYFALVAQPGVMELLSEDLMDMLAPYFNIMQNYYKQKGVPNPMAYTRLMGALLDGISLNYIMDPENFPLEDIKRIIIEKFI